MGLYDIMDEIAAKQVTKSETGDNRILGVVLGIVVKNYDPEMKGRVCVQIPVRDEDANELKWARVAMLSGGKEWGHYFLPEVGDQVLLVFEQGNIEKPYVIGCVSRENDRFLTRAVTEDNQIKKIVTKNGNTIQFDDMQEEDGKQDKISVYTAGKAHQLVLDNENNKISLSDKAGNNKIEIESENGKIEIKTEHKLNIKVGDNLELVMNADSGTVSIKCEKFKVDASGGVDINSSGKLGMEGGNIKIGASSVLKIESSGMASIAGAPVKMG